MNTRQNCIYGRETIIEQCLFDYILKRVWISETTYTATIDLGMSFSRVVYVECSDIFLFVYGKCCPAFHTS